MRIGMLWYSGDPKLTFAEKCNGAIKYFTDKYGVQPTAIVVHPSMGVTGIPGVTITTSKSVLPNHFWVGILEE